MKKLVIIILLISSHLTFSQTVTKSFPGPVANASCPEEDIQYEVSLPTGFAGCQITWTATNGSVKSQNANIVVIRWKDIPGAVAKLQATFINCGEENKANNGKTSNEFTETILSVKGLNFAAFNNNVNVDFCNTNSVTLNVPQMLVPGTGGAG